MWGEKKAVFQNFRLLPTKDFAILQQKLLQEYKTHNFTTLNCTSMPNIYTKET